MNQPTTGLFEYLRVSVTDRCNLRCRYCMPEEGVEKLSHQDVLRYEEILEIIRAAVAEGVIRVRVTGGEPLVRKGIVSFIAQVREIPQIKDLSLTTNGVFLAEMAHDLRQAGLDRINISLDSLNPERYRSITRGGDLSRVLHGIEEARMAGLWPIKINVVLLPGENEDELEDFVRFAADSGVPVRFIEHMPFISAHQVETFVSQDELLTRIQRVFALTPTPVEHGGGPACEYLLPDGKGRIGFISPRSQPFCRLCTRLRLTAAGVLLPCLEAPQGISVRNLSFDEIRQAIRQLSLEKGALGKSCASFQRACGVSLSDIGG